MKKNWATSSYPIAQAQRQVGFSAKSQQSPPKFNRFLRTLEDIMVEGTTLEISTMVVEQINNHPFVPWEVYRDLYPISPTYLQRQRYHPLVHEAYLDMRAQLEWQYTLLLIDPTSDFYDANCLRNMGNTTQDSIESAIASPDFVTQLPNPLNPTDKQEFRKVRQLLTKSRFHSHLCQLGEQKVALDNRNYRLLHRAYTVQEADKLLNDVVYAQTTVHLDGNITNCYTAELFEHPHQAMILQIHQDNLVAGEQLWRRLLGLLLSMMQSILNRGLLHYGQKRSQNQPKS